MPVPVDTLRDLLTDPATYPYDPEEIRLKQTHISVVAVAPPYVYKFKKPVDFGFLDFSTLEKRRDACEAEVRLNRRLCAHTYEGVVPLVRTGGQTRVDPEEETEASVVEYAVKMRYLPPEHFLHHRAEDERLTAADVDRVVRHLADFYHDRPSTPEIAEAGWIDRIRVSTDENFAQTEALAGDLLPRPTFEAVRYYTDRFFDQHATLFHQRRAGGFVVEGHGDLRLGHVHLTDEQVCIYDCIEFNERLRRLDWANDIAFLAMDFDVHGRADLGRHFVHRMQEALNDPALTTLIDFYKTYRAYVRGKVEGLQAADADLPPEERDESRAAAQRYYRRALRYAVNGGAPLVAVVMGTVGSGKSTQAEALAEALGWERVSSDRVRKSLAGVPLEAQPDAEARAQLYTSEMSARTYGALRDRALKRSTSPGGTGTILDATYSRRAERERLRSRLRAADVPYVFVECTAPDDILKHRLAARTASTAHGSDARLDDFDMLQERYEAPTALEDARHVRVSTEPDPTETTTDILKHLIRMED